MSAGRARALAALKASDRKLARLIEAAKPIDLKAWRQARPVDDPFSVLVYSIIGQQISGFAARAIAGRLLERFNGRMPSPAEVLAMDPADLKAVGLSGRKVEYVRSLAEHIISGELQVDHLEKLSDDEVREQITASRGLGRWSADMFLLINLERPDILPIGDLWDPIRGSAPLPARPLTQSARGRRDRRKMATQPQPGELLPMGRWQADSKGSEPSAGRLKDLSPRARLRTSELATTIRVPAAHQRLV